MTRNVVVASALLAAAGSAVVPTPADAASPLPAITFPEPTFRITWSNVDGKEGLSHSVGHDFGARRGRMTLDGVHVSVHRGPKGWLVQLSCRGEQHRLKFEQDGVIHAGLLIPMDSEFNGDGFMTLDEHRMHIHVHHHPAQKRLQIRLARGEASSIWNTVFVDHHEGADGGAKHGKVYSSSSVLFEREKKKPGKGGQGDRWHY